jgi:GH15 family glucan-1,4-alpha-glucosidase
LHDEATAWRDWLLGALGGDPEKLRIAYRVDGACDLDESDIEWLSGYGGARPVRSGNAAWRQHQLDVFGEVIDSLSIAVRGGIPASKHAAHVEGRLVEHLEAVWQLPGQGLWESRGEPRHYVYSKVMAWVGIDRYLRRAEAGRPTADTALRLRELRARMHAQICDEGYDTTLGTFVQRYGSRELDASLLLLPALGFLPATDPRMARTIAAIERELVVDGLVMRTATPDGTRPEGAFLACTCWLADCLGMQGRHAEARAALERVLSVRNDLGLLSEEYDLEHRCLSGNFPQALTHLALINTALSLCGPVLQRAA